MACEACVTSVRCMQILTAYISLHILPAHFAYCTCNQSQVPSRYISPNQSSGIQSHRLPLVTMILTSPIDLTKHVDLGSVSDKTVLITGGANSDGIGFGVAEAMAQNGYVCMHSVMAEAQKQPGCSQ